METITTLLQCMSTVRTWMCIHANENGKLAGRCMRNGLRWMRMSMPVGVALVLVLGLQQVGVQGG